MAGLKHSIEAALATVLQASVRPLSDKSADRTGAFLGRLMFRLLGSRRRIALDNLKSVYGDQWDDAKRRSVAVEAFENVGRTFVEVARFGKVTREQLGARYTGQGREELAEVHAHGKGGLIVTAHFGNWEMVGNWPVILGYPANILVNVHRNEKFDRIYNRRRRDMGVNVITVGENVKEVFRALKRNEFCGIAADQHDPTNSLILDFLGRPASVFKGPAVFSLRTGAPIIPMMLIREGADRHRFACARPIYPESTGVEDDDVRRIVSNYLKFFEKIIHEHPGLWMWTHRRWKYRPPETVRESH